MVRTLRAALRRNPQLRALARSCLWWVERTKARALGTRYHERHWRNRHLSGGSDWGDDDDWILSYWNSREHPHRAHLIDRAMKYAPGSVLEFGCNCGPNLSLLREADSGLELVGIDINPVAIQAGRELLEREAGGVVDLVQGGIEALSAFPIGRFDVFLTDAVLLYVGPDRIREVLKEAVRLSRKGVVMLEWHEPLGPLVKGFRDTFVRGHWVRDYRAWLEPLVGPDRVRATKLPEGLWPGEEWSRWGHVIEVDLRDRTPTGLP